jgi:hypothetical protein
MVIANFRLSIADLRKAPNQIGNRQLAIGNEKAAEFNQAARDLHRSFERHPPTNRGGLFSRNA